MKHIRSLKKIACAALAGVTAVAAAATFTACETSRPEVEIKLSFNNATYTLEYKLYRKIAPSTVQHFIELADHGYYDGLCVHNYVDSSRMYTGGYTYDESQTDNGGLIEKDYFSTVADWGLTQTVWKDEARSEGLNTVYGEFSANGFEVTNGTLSQTYGSLTMYYTAKSSKGGSTLVNTKRSDGTDYNFKTYKYNSATSLFFISLSTGSSSSSEYCTFGELLDDDSKEALDDLKEAISTYISDNYSDDEDEDNVFAPSYSVLVDENDPIDNAAKNKADYAVPQSPIVITSVKVTKY